MKIIVKEEHQQSLLQASFLGPPLQDRDVQLALRQEISTRQYPRDALADILAKYNLSIGNDPYALKQIERFKGSDSVCVFSGQQLGMMGGPAYLVLKALSCLMIAKEMDAIPIFWLATEDHDLAEISHTYLLDAKGNLEKYSLHFPRDGRAVEDLDLSYKNVEEIGRYLDTVGISQEFYFQAGESYALAMASFLAARFAGTGLLFIEPRYLRPLAVPFFQQEIDESEKILGVLRETTKRLEAAGGHAVLPLREGTNLFLKEDLSRRKIRYDGIEFSTGVKNYSKKQLLALIQQEPERFSTNVAARPVLQSKLFPTLAYVAGPSEMAYFRQLGDYHGIHDVLMPLIIPRLSATLIPPRAALFLEKCNLKPWELIPHHWIELMPSVAESVHALMAEWNQSALDHFKEDVSPEALLRQVRWSARKIQRKVCKARVGRQEIPFYALHYLNNLIHPHGKLQERVLNWWGFQATAEDNLISSFLKETDWIPSGHRYCYYR